MTDLRHLALPGAEIAVRVTPRSSRERIVTGADIIRAHVTAPPEDGRANAAVQAALARVPGIAKSRLTPVRGRTARDKVFRFEDA